MAVYTDISDDALARFLAEYDLGTALSCKGIAEGVENSNFLLRTSSGQYILTLYERRVQARDLPFFLGLMEHLAARGFPCATPVRARDDAAFRTLSGRPAALVTFLDGIWPRNPTPGHCAQLGAAIARLHESAQDFALGRANDLSVTSWRPLFEANAARANDVQDGLGAELAADIADLETRWPSDLPSGVIHADLFPDNVFFLGDRLSGVIDFYFACTEFLAYDLAVALNAWCFDDTGAFVADNSKALFAGYEDVRPLTGAETAALPLLARGAALRFLLTRLHDWLNRVTGALVQPKDPLEFAAKLRFHRGVTDAATYGVAPRP